jgi:hypothetical protein
MSGKQTTTKKRAKSETKKKSIKIINKKFSGGG